MEVDIMENYIEEISNDVINNVDLARMNLADSIYKQAILEGLSQLIDTLVVSRKIKKVKKSLKSLFTNEHDVIDEQEQNRNKFDKR